MRNYELLFNEQWGFFGPPCDIWLCVAALLFSSSFTLQSVLPAAPHDACLFSSIFLFLRRHLASLNAFRKTQPEKIARDTQVFDIKKCLRKVRQINFHSYILYISSK